MGQLVEVRVAGALRLEPNIEAPVFARVAAGTRLYVVATETTTSGWIRAASVEGPSTYERCADVCPPIAIGWIEAVQTVALDLHCPEPPLTVDDLSGQPPLIPLACYGDGQLVLRSVVPEPFPCCGPMPAYQIEPYWLGATYGGGWFPGRIDPAAFPELPVMLPGDELELSGSFDSPTSEQCRALTFPTGPDQSEIPELKEAAVLHCRSQFVVEELDVTTALRPDGLAEVVTNDLVVRSEPGVTATSVILPDLLQAGDRLYVMEGPVHVSPYDWYHVQPIRDGDWPAAGWVAAADRDGERWIAAVAPWCPSSDELEVEQIAGKHSLEALSCLGGREHSVRASFAGCSGFIPGEHNYWFEPRWLTPGWSYCQWDGVSGFTAFEAYYVEGGSGFPGDLLPGSWVWLVGQFDHPDAKGCVLVENTAFDDQMPPAPALDEDQAVLACRARFAVHTIERADPPD